MYNTDDMMADRWFRVVKQDQDPRVRLVCFPHAGGAASFFRTWATCVPDGVEVLAVCYPGREDRVLDPPAETMEELAEPIARACSGLSAAPLAFFGHSMGAMVSYEVALRLQSERRTPFVALFVSGCSGPWRSQPQNLARRDDAGLIDHVRLLGGTDAQAFEIVELRDLVLPVIRADFRLIDNYEPPGREAMIDAPVFAYYGRQDPDVDEDSVSGWSEATRSSFGIRSFGGGHFYLADHTRALVEDMLARLGTTARCPEPAQRGLAYHIPVGGAAPDPGSRPPA
jgi:surfactin synthase thioesterase subunit